MKLYIKQKVFSWGDKFSVKNEAGADVFRVKGDAFSFSHRLHVFDAGETEIATLHRKVFSFRPRYFIETGGETFTIAKNFTFFNHRFYYQELPLVVEGDFWAHSYVMRDTQTGLVVMRVEKRWFSWGDSY
jgi:uncharacterized protein YxjI